MRLRLTPGWAVSMDAKGRLYVIDAAGIRPLEHPDPVQRLFAVHLAAAAPGLRNALQEITHRMEYLHPVQPLFERKDARIIQQAHGAIICSRPQWFAVEQAIAQAREGREKRAA